MLRIAVQTKGRLHEETMRMLEESGIKLESTKRLLLLQSKDFPVEVLFLRDDDIPQAVATGIADAGVIGENEYVEKNEDAEIVKRLNFSKCRLAMVRRQKDCHFVSPYIKEILGRKGDTCRHTHNNRLGGNRSGHKPCRLHFRHSKLRQHLGQQQPERGGSRDEVGGVDDLQQKPQ